MALTKVTGHVVLPTTNIEFHNTKSTGIVTFTDTTQSTSATTGGLQIAGGVGIVKNLNVGGNLNVTGNLTYTDVDNINSVGIITANSNIEVGGFIKHLGNTSTMIGFPSDNNIQFKINNVEKFRVDSSGNIGVNTSNPHSELEVFSDTFADITIGSARTDANIGGLNFRKTLPGGAHAGIMTAQYFVDTYGSHYFHSQGSERLKISSDGDLLITGSDNAELKLKCGTSTGDSVIAFLNSSGTTKGNIFYDSDNNFMVFKTNGTGSSNERLRIDASGVLLKGHTTASADLHDSQTVIGRSPRFQIHGAEAVNAALALISWKSGTGSYYSPNIYLARSGSDTKGTNALVANSAPLGAITFNGDDGGEFAKAAVILGEVDGTSGADDMPGRLIFKTTPSGTQVPEERLRIQSSGNIQIGTAADPGNVLRYVDIGNYNTGSSAGSILRLLTVKSDGSSSTSADIVKYKAGGLVINNNEVLGTTGYISFGTGTAGGSVTEKLRIKSDGHVIIAESMAVNRPRIVLSAPNDGTNYRHLFGANLQVDSSGTFTTPTANISGGGWEYLPANSLSDHGSIRYLSAPDTNATTSTPLERFRIDSNGKILNTAATNTVATLDLYGGNTTVSAVGEVNGQIRFRSKDDSVTNNEENVGGAIKSIVEYSNGAYVGLSFETYKQDRTPRLQEALRITHAGNVLVAHSTAAITDAYKGNALEVGGSTYAKIALTSGTNTLRADWLWDDANVYFRTSTASNLFLGTDNTPRIKIANNSAATTIGGNLTFNAMLTVQGDLSGAIFQLKAAENTTRMMVSGLDTSDVEVNLYDKNGGQRGILVGGETEFALKAPNSSAPMTFYTHNGSSMGERLRITSTGIHQITTPGNTTDGTYFSTLTINNTGSSTWSRIRFDRSGVARWGLSLRTDDKFAITNLYTDGSSGSPDDDTFVISNSGNISMSGYLTAKPSPGNNDNQLAKGRNYTWNQSTLSPSSPYESGWYPIMDISDGQYLFMIGTNAHNSATCLITNGYDPSAVSRINVLNCVRNNNGNYLNIQEIRVLNNGVVEVYLYASNPTYFGMYIQMISNHDVPNFYATLTKNTGSPTVDDGKDFYTYSSSVGSGLMHVENLRVDGTISKGTDNFTIEHPLASKKDTHLLNHSMIEGPQCDNIYRGKVTLSSGAATVNLDTVSNMTEGTFIALNRDVQCFTTNETGWGAVKGSVSGNILTISAQDNSSTDTISWMVVGERQDDVVKKSNSTDSDGHLIVEQELDSNAGLVTGDTLPSKEP